MKDYKPQMENAKEYKYEELKTLVHIIIIVFYIVCLFYYIFIIITLIVYSVYVLFICFTAFCLGVLIFTLFQDDILWFRFFLRMA